MVTRGRRASCGWRVSRGAVSFAFVVLGACSGGGHDGGVTDATTETSAHVVAVDCATSPPVQTIATVGAGETGMYSPTSVTISIGQVVRFVLTTDHNVTPNVGTDAAVSVDFGVTKCLRFDTSGTYAFHCSTHGFQGSVVVQ